MVVCKDSHKYMIRFTYDRVPLSDLTACSVLMQALITSVVVKALYSVKYLENGGVVWGLGRCLHGTHA
jgi:hypothetical protein